MKKRLCTVFILTYNHAPYIRDAIEHVLSQKTDFDFDIFIFDDCSTDGTSEIVREYVDKYPNRIHAYIASNSILQFAKKNYYDINISNNIYDENIKGRYVAWCEGDDYWIDDYKLQSQIDILEQNEEISMVAHSSWWEDCTSGEKRAYRPFHKNGVLEAADIILQRTGNISTASLVMRRNVLIKSKDFPVCDIGDVPIQLNAILQGKVYYIDKIMSVYRYMHAGSWSSNVNADIFRKICHCLWMVNFYIEYDIFTNGRYHQPIEKRMYDYWIAGIDPFLSMTTKDYNNILEKIEDEIPLQMVKYVKNASNLFSFFKKEYSSFQMFYVDEIRKAKHLVIMGIGKYSEYVREWLKYCDIPYSGYLVSDGQENQLQRGDKQVWHISEYPYDYHDTAVIVAIHPCTKVEIEPILIEKGCFYCSPYWI